MSVPHEPIDERWRGAAPLAPRTGAPLTVQVLLSAVLEPVLAVAMLAAVHAAFGQPLQRWAMAIAIAVVALTFPGRWPERTTPKRLLAAVARQWAALLAILLLCAYVLGALRELNWALLLPWALATPLVHAVARVGLHGWFARRARRDIDQRTAVIVGGGELAARTARALGDDPHTPRRVVGHFDSRADSGGESLPAIECLGGLADVERYVARLGVREVYVALALDELPALHELLAALKATPASVYHVPDVYGLQLLQGRQTQIGDLPVLALWESPLVGVNALVKRSLDITLAAAALAVAWPLLLAGMIACRLAGHAPPIVTLRRQGLHGDEILIHRLRTRASVHDERPAARMRWLERSGLDRLPELIDVLAGRLSLVGPMPLPMNGPEPAAMPGFALRHMVRPGMFGPGQRENGVLAEMLADDLEYLRRWSLAADLRVMARSGRRGRMASAAHRPRCAPPAQAPQRR